MKIKPIAPAALPSVAEAERLVTERTRELDAIRADILAAEKSLYDLAESDDDEAFETASLVIERQQRAKMRADKRLITAEVVLDRAKASDEQQRRKALYAEGQKAAAEAGKLADAYSEHANAIAEILRKIDKLREPVESANADLPEGERRIDAHAFGIHSHVDLPAATKDGPKFWWRPDYYGRGPLHPQPKHSPGHILIEGVCVPFDEGNPAHIAARDARPSILLPPVSKSQSQPVSDFGERTLPDGSRKIMLPPNEWPPKPDSEQH